MERSTVISLALSLALIGGTLYLVSGGSPSNGGNVLQTQNTEIRDGIQYVTIDAKGGYYPGLSGITAGLPTKLIVRTNGTYDCSAALVVRSAGFQGMLQPTGEVVIDLGTPKSGDKIKGVCGMGMYSFELQAS